MKEVSLAKAVPNPFENGVNRKQPFGLLVQGDFCLASMPFATDGSPVLTFQSPILHAIRGAYANATRGGGAAALHAAAAAQHRMHVLDKILGAHGGKAASRAIFKRLVGIDLGPSRPPLTELDAAGGDALLADLRAAGFDFPRFVPAVGA